MLLYLKNLVQLILSPQKGWEDISASLQKPDTLLKNGYYPLLGIAALSEFVRLAYGVQYGLSTILELAIALFGTYFISYFIARLILDYYLRPMIDGELNRIRSGLFTIYGLSLMAIIEIIDNLIPTDLTIIKFLPVFVALILYRGNKFMAIKQDSEIRFLFLLTVALIFIPICIFCILKLIIA